MHYTNYYITFDSMVAKTLYKSESVEWETPQYLFNSLNNTFHFQIDVCATAANAKCKKFFAISDNGLEQDWGQGRCWMNPPYGRNIAKWMQKAYESSQKGAIVVCLVPSRTDTAWWHDWVEGKAEVVFLRGRLRFGNSPHPAPFPSVLVIYWPPDTNPFEKHELI